MGADLAALPDAFHDFAVLLHAFGTSIRPVMIQVHRDDTVSRLNSLDSGILHSVAQCLVEAAVAHAVLESIHGVQRLAPRPRVVALEIRGGGSDSIEKN